MESCARRFGTWFTVRFPGRLTFVFTSDPDAIKDVFSGDPDKLHAGESNSILKPLLGENSLLMLDGARHQRTRQLMLPPFHGERMQAYGATIQQISDRSIDQWPVGRPFPIRPQMQSITLDVILRTVFGLEEGKRFVLLRDKLTRLLSATVNPFLLMLINGDGEVRMPQLQRALGPWIPWRRHLQEASEILYAEMAQRRTTGEEGRSDILSMLMEARDENGQPLSDVELRDEMLTLLLAGHETTATALSWIFYRLVCHPNVLERLQMELTDVLGKGPIHPQQLGRLLYLEATIQETLRLHPIVPIVARLLKTPMQLGGRELPAGVVVAPCIYLTHRRPDLWPDPERFDPDRFLNKPAAPWNYFPFGGGGRRCLGMAFAMYEMKMILAQTLRRVRLARSPGYTARTVRRGITLVPSKGMPIVASHVSASRDN